jgi:hypothetical protein
MDCGAASAACRMPGVVCGALCRVWLFLKSYFVAVGAVRLVAGYLVDPASSHMLVSKIKPCMSKYKRLVL